MIVFTQIHPAIQEEESTSNFIKIDGVRGETLRRLIEFCYTGRIILTDQNNEAILAAATLLGIERVRDMCEKRSRRCLSVNNCLSLWSLAEQYNLEQLNGHAMAMIAAAFRWLADDGHIVHVRPALFLRLLANDNLCVLDEEDIYCAVIQWVKFNEELRKSVFPELMTLVRVEHLTISVSNFGWNLLNNSINLIIFFIYQVFLSSCETAMRGMVIRTILRSAVAAKEAVTGFRHAETSLQFHSAGSPIHEMQYYRRPQLPRLEQVRLFGEEMEWHDFTEGELPIQIIKYGAGWWISVYHWRIWLQCFRTSEYGNWEKFWIHF